MGRSGEKDMACWVLEIWKVPQPSGDAELISGVARCIASQAMIILYYVIVSGGKGRNGHEGERAELSVVADSLLLPKHFSLYLSDVLRH